MKQSPPEVLYRDTLDDSKSYPIVFRPTLENVEIYSWLKNNQNELNLNLYKHGAILFRGFNISDASAFENFLKSMSDEIMEYKHRSSPRHEIQNHIYTSTDHPNDQFINMHTEHSYSHEWPLKIVFCCVTPSEIGGETPIADTRILLYRLRESTKEKFIKKGVLYVRNLGNGLGMDWKKVFQTESKNDVEAYCAKYNVRYSWGDEEKLKLEFIRPAIRRHPITGEFCWFNHAFFFNILSLEDSLRHDLLEMGDMDLFPFLTYYGDGTPIESSVIDEIRSIYNELMVSFSWEKGDVLLVDNMVMAHGRMPFIGAREILVGMLEPVSM